VGAIFAQQGPPDGLAVRILNTPVPVTGSIAVSGTVAATQSGPWATTVSGTVAATQSGPWAVNATLQGTPTVIIGNSLTNPALVVDISKAASNIVELGCFARVGERSGPCVRKLPSGSSGGVFTVPAGLMFVVTGVDAIIEPAFGQTSPVTVEMLFGHAPPDVIATGSYFLTNRWLVSNAASPMTQLQFNTGVVIASGHQIVFSVTFGATTSLDIRGYLTPM
jgi:hypothetical protein